MSPRWIVRNRVTGETARTSSEHMAVEVVRRFGALCEVIEVRAVEGSAAGGGSPSPSSGLLLIPGRPGSRDMTRHPSSGRPPTSA